MFISWGRQLWRLDRLSRIYGPTIPGPENEGKTWILQADSSLKDRLPNFEDHWKFLNSSIISFSHRQLKEKKTPFSAIGSCPQPQETLKTLLPFELERQSTSWLRKLSCTLKFRLDKTSFHVVGAILFTAQQALIHPTAVVKTRMQVADSRFAHMPGMLVFKHILRNDGIPGIFRGFGTSAIGSLPGRVLALTSLEMSKDLMLKYTEGLDMAAATLIGLANGMAGMFSSLISSLYFVPLDVICQRLMMQGLPGATFYNDPFDVARKVIKAEGFRGLYRGFGLTALTNSPASALWSGAYGAAQRIIWRSLGYRDDAEKKPSHMEMVTVQATAGMVAGACSSAITTPIDTVMDDYGVGRPSVLKTTKTLLKEDGWWGFYRGFGPRFLNMSLYGTTMIVTYELISMSTLLIISFYLWQSQSLTAGMCFHFHPCH
ncbi:Mitochondrial substrate/solute carrier - like 10 [Theobroma cacao]|nr:Mitochondrial substrate/solute carrier - like 10 [Theobroma cacao]